MFDQLTGLGYGLVVFAIIIGVGSVVLQNFGSATASCPTAYATYNTSSGLCYNSTGSTTTASVSSQNTYYLMGQLGQSGLAGWTPAIVAIAVGLLFLGAFMIKGSKKGRY